MNYLYQKNLILLLLRCLAMLLIGPIMLGIFALILPGLFLVARWIAAPAFVAARGGSAWAAAGASWQTVRGHTGKIASIVVMMFLIASLFGTLGAAVGAVLAIGANWGLAYFIFQVKWVAPSATMA